MSHDPNSDLSRAIAALTIAQIWAAAGLRGEPPKRDGLVESPLRDDKKPSFSVFSQGRAFKDHASGEKGGLWKFAQLAWPNLPGRELAEQLIELSGVPRSRPPAPGERPVDPRLAALAAAPRELRPALRAAFKRKDERAAEQRIYTEREAALRPRMEVRRVPVWPACVEQRYYAGVDALRDDPELLEEIADDRGWPVRWAEAVLEDERLAFPVLPWSEPGQRYGKRGKAFLVQCPESVDEDSRSLRLRPVGYHQRFFMLQRDGKPGKKSWCYVPNCPAEDRVRNEFLRQLRDEGLSRGIEHGTAMVPALPFVLSDRAAAIGPARLVVLTEGQWDAISLAGACGWLDERCWPEGVAVFGLRGNEGMDTFLAYYGYWLTACQPVVWVLADNDAAGAKWLAPEKPDGGTSNKLLPPTVAEKLANLKCRKVVLSVLRPENGSGKDFNDLWRQKHPTAAAMRAWMTKLGLPDMAASAAQ